MSAAPLTAADLMLPVPTDRIVRDDFGAFRMHAWWCPCGKAQVQTEDPSTGSPRARCVECNKERPAS